MKEGSYVRHRGAPEWGIGRVLRIGTDEIQIEFRGRTRTLKLAVAGQHLDEITAAEMTDPTNAVRARIHASSDPAPRIPCIACARPLNEPQFREEERWKSCPACSVRGGREHIFRPFPEAFVEADLSMTAAGSSARDSVCTACRTGVALSAKARSCTNL
jgi:hypothetical protein